MFANLLPLVAATTLLFATADSPCTEAAVEAPVAESLPEMVPGVSARLYISYVGNGYYQVVIDGQSTAPNASVGARVYGEDTWFDDRLFSMGGGYTRTDFTGRFNFGMTVHRSLLNEDWEGTDEIYAIVDVSGAGSVRTNKISQSF